jgi:hypothetical protein
MTDLLGGIPPALLQGVGYSGLVILFIVAVTRGWIVIGSRHTQAIDDLRKHHDEQTADLRAQRDDWRDAYRAEAAVNAVQTGQLEKLVDQGRTFVHLFDSLRAILPLPGSQSADEGETP